MKIHDIKRLQNGKYKITIDDDVIITYEDVIIDLKLLFKKEINKTEYNNLINKTSYYEKYNKVLKYVLKAKKSEKEINDYMDKLNINSIDKIEIINKLKNINLINDYEYTKTFINDKILLNKWGINKIKKALVKNNINSNIIYECINNIDEELIKNNLEKIIIKKINSNKKYSNKYLKQKILTELTLQGYNKNDIIYIIENNIKESNDIIKKEYNKLINKYKNKYNEKELKLYVKNKLLAKGFTYEEISKIKTEE